MSKIEIHKDDLEALKQYNHTIAHATLDMKQAHELFLVQQQTYLDICEKRSQALLLAEQAASALMERVMKGVQT